MKKSKFLKKSLAMLLALMLVVAMIPLSAAAAYAPAEGLTPVAATGKVTAVSGGWNIVFNYSSTLPTITFQTGNGDETISYIDKDGLTQTNGLAGITVWKDDKGACAPITFWVVNNGEASDRYKITWSMEDASNDVSVKSAKIGDYTGVVNEAARTIKFTLPFGYAEKLSDTVSATITFEGATTSSATQTVVLNTNVGTNERKAGEVPVTVQPENDVTDITYTVTAEEEEGLTSIKIGDYEGVFETKPSDPNKGYETGTIKFNVPADLAADTKGKLNLAVAYEVGSNYTKAVYDSSVELTNGEEYDFAALLSTTKTLTLENANGSREYTLEFVKNDTDTAITSFTATGNDSSSTPVIAVDGTVDGSNLNVELPYNADLTKSIVLDFVGPKATGSADPSITVGNESPVNFSTAGKAQVTINGYTSPLTVKVVAADGKTQKFYTLTITKAAAAFNEPKVTSAKITMYKGTSNELEVTGTITGTTITFTLPHSTLDKDLKEDGTNTVYTFAKTSMTNLNKTALSGTPTFEDGSSVIVTTDNGTSVVYTVKFERKAAETGKTISNFVLSTETTNKNLMNYNANQNYSVTVSGNEFKVTLPTTPGTLYPDFTLSTGAKLYQVNTTGKTFTEVKAYDAKTGDAPASMDPKDTAKAVDFYIVADETLATVIDNDPSITFAKVENKYSSNYTKYEFNVTPKDETGDRLTALSAKDGKISAKIVSGNGIELTVPYGYATGSTFYFDYTLSQGATIEVTPTSKSAVQFYSNGHKSWANDKVTADPASDTSNPNFQIVYNAGSKVYELKVLDAGSTYTVVDKFTVTPQSGSPRDYKITKITVQEANTGAAITALKANNTSATINGKNITVNLPFGTNLGQVKLAITASEMAVVTISGNDVEADPDKLYDLTKPLEIKVVSEDGKNINVYTLTAKIADQFTDVSEGAWYYENVMAAVEAGIVSGMGDGTFKPMGNITRRDFATMVTKLLLNGQEPPKAETTPFSDVSSSDYALNAIAYCAENGIISGSNGEFRPGDYITRQEAASIMKNALKLTGTTSDLFADDAKIADWAKANVYACKADGIFKGDEKNNFNPTNPITRAEAASIMVNALNK